MTAPILDSFDDIYDNAVNGRYFDYSAQTIVSVSWLEHIVRWIFSKLGCMDSTTEKCIHVSSEALKEGLKTPTDTFVGANLRAMITQMGGGNSASLQPTIDKVNGFAPHLIQECLRISSAMQAALKQSAVNPALMSHQALQQRSLALDVRETSVQKREEAVKEQENEVAAAKEEVAAEKEALAERSAELDKREEDLAARETLMKEFEKSPMYQQFLASMRAGPGGVAAPINVSRSLGDPLIGAH